MTERKYGHMDVKKARGYSSENKDRRMRKNRSAGDGGDTGRRRRNLFPPHLSDTKTRMETGNRRRSPTQSSRLRQVLNEINPYGFSVPYKIENLYIIEDYNGRNWYEHKQIPIQAAAEATVYWAKTEKRPPATPGPSLSNASA